MKKYDGRLWYILLSSKLLIKIALCTPGSDYISWQIYSFPQFVIQNLEDKEI